MKLFKTVGLLVLLAIAIVFPQIFPNGEITSIAFFTLLFAAMVTGWNILAGYSGYIALGHAVYFGIGAYALAIICDRWGISATAAWGPVPGGYTIFLLVPVAGLIAAVIAIPTGWVALRVRRHTFIIITIALFFIGQLLSFNLPGLTKGSAGFDLPLPFQWGGDFFNTPFYYAVLVLLLLAIVVSWWVRQSKYGLGLLAIRDDEDRAKGLGVKTEFSKLTAFVLSAFIVGMAGALWAYFIGTVYPSSTFDPTFDLALALMGFLGGMGTISGPILGALILEPIRQYLASTYPAWYLVIYGALFLVVLLLLPRGILPTIQDVWTKYRARLLDRLHESNVAVSSSAWLPTVMLVATKHGVPLLARNWVRKDEAVITPLPEQGEPAVVTKKGVNL
ncbi:MAG TPA: branched-chain amino acid ABC transporter permease [Ktedonobacteraceae bacterium]|jgi:branched-chain amino acid transport system permease protein